MSTPLLATKLYIPPLRRTLVRRPRLVERMNAGVLAENAVRRGISWSIRITREGYSSWAAGL
jgi:hypothetical protein